MGCNRTITTQLRVAWEARGILTIGPSDIGFATALSRVAYPTHVGYWCGYCSELHIT